MGSLIGLLVGKQIFGKTITEGVARWMVTAALFVVVLGACAALIAAYNHHVIHGYQQKQAERAAPAANSAAAERANDTYANTKAQQEMHDVIEKQPDQPIAPTSHARGCEQLRRVGKHPAACS